MDLDGVGGHVLFSANALGFGNTVWRRGGFRGEGCGVILFWVRWREKGEEFTTEFAEGLRGRGEDEEKRRRVGTLDRKNPPFAKGAKDGAPKFCCCVALDGRPKSTDKSVCATSAR